MSVVEQKKERIRVALQELDHPTCKMSACEAMRTLGDVWSSGFFEESDESDCTFAGDDFKEEIYSARVVQTLITVAQDNNAYPESFYQSTWYILYFICSNNTELANAFVANGGVGFLLEALEDFSSNQYLLIFCFAVYKAVIESLDANEKDAFAGMTLGKLVDVFELNYDTADEELYINYCFAVCHSFGHGNEVIGNSLKRILSHAWRGVIKHKYDEEAQDVGRFLLRHLVPKSAKMLIDHAEMRHCAEEDCARCA
jgi:hypothetical protein